MLLSVSVSAVLLSNNALYVSSLYNVSLVVISGSVQRDLHFILNFLCISCIIFLGQLYSFDMLYITLSSLSVSSSSSCCLQPVAIVQLITEGCELVCYIIFGAVRHNDIFRCVLLVYFVSNIVVHIQYQIDKVQLIVVILGFKSKPYVKIQRVDVSQEAVNCGRIIPYRKNIIYVIEPQHIYHILLVVQEDFC